MLQIAKAAFEELHVLFHVHEPIWFSRDGRIVMDHKNYHTMFPKDSDPNVFKTPDTREESSLAFMKVNMTAMKLVEAFLDPKQMTELFPSMIRRAEIIKEYEHGAVGTKHGALLLMYTEIHHLSHLVPPRNYFFLRYCEKVDDSGIWVISDVSLNSMGTDLPRLPSWKLPSGCLIQQMPTYDARNSIIVKWIEHVEVNKDRPQIGLLYGDLVAKNIPYSAEQWIMILERNAEKLEYSAEEGRRRLLKLLHRMLKSFCEILNMYSKPETIHFNKNNIKYAVRNHPLGVIATLVTSFWLPLNFYNVFNFLTDAAKRNQWDPLCVGYSVFEALSFGTGLSIDNRLSIIQPYDRERNEVLIFQESSIDQFTAHIVYIPIDTKNLQSPNNQASSQLVFLPSGFVLSADGNSVADILKSGMANPQQGGTVITMCYQMLISSTPSIPSTIYSPSSTYLHKELEAAHTIFRMMVNNVKAALGCSCRK